MPTPPEQGRRDADNKTTTSTPSFRSSARLPSTTPAANQLAYQREAVLWRAFRRALFLDIEEGSLESATIRALAHAAWSDAFLATVPAS